MAGDGWEELSPEESKVVMAQLQGKDQAPYQLNTVDRAADARQRLELQARTGQPVLMQSMDPYFAIKADPKAYGQARVDGVKAAQARSGQVEKNVAEVRKYGEYADNVLRALNSGTNTGGVINNLPGVGWLRGAVDPNVQALEAASAIVAKSNRVPGDIISNYDAQLLQRAAPGLGKSEQFNRNWALGAKAAARQAEDYQTFRESFVATNGTENGLAAAWKMYTTSHPIFARGKNGQPVYDKSGAPVINNKRPSWQQFFQQRAKGVLYQQQKPASGWGKARVVK